MAKKKAAKKDAPVKQKKRERSPLVDDLLVFRKQMEEAKEFLHDEGMLISEYKLADVIEDIDDHIEELESMR